MARMEMTVHVDAKNLDRVRLLMWELYELASDMRVAASPFAERLDSIIDRAEHDEAGDREEPT